MKAKFTPAQKQIRELSEQIVAAQRPVRMRLSGMRASEKPFLKTNSPNCRK